MYNDNNNDNDDKITKKNNLIDHDNQNKTQSGQKDSARVLLNNNQRRFGLGWLHSSPQAPAQLQAHIACKSHVPFELT